MKNITKRLSKSIFSTISSKPPLNSTYTKKTFSDKVKFNYEDPLNLNSLLTEEEQMVKIKSRLLLFILIFN